MAVLGILGGLKGFACVCINSGVRRVVRAFRWKWESSITAYPFPYPIPFPQVFGFVFLMTDWRTDFKPSFDERHTVYRSMTDWRLNFSNSLYRELVGLCCLVMSRYQSLRHQSVIKVLCVWITADDGLKSVRHCIIIFDVLGRFWAIALC